MTLRRRPRWGGGPRRATRRRSATWRIELIWWAPRLARRVTATSGATWRRAVVSTAPSPFLIRAGHWRRFLRFPTRSAPIASSTRYAKHSFSPGGSGIRTLCSRFVLAAAGAPALAGFDRQTMANSLPVVFFLVIVLSFDFD